MSAPLDPVLFIQSFIRATVDDIGEPMRVDDLVRLTEDVLLCVRGRVAPLPDGTRVAEVVDYVKDFDTPGLDFDALLQRWEESGSGETVEDFAAWGVEWAVTEQMFIVGTPSLGGFLASRRAHEAGGA